MIRVYLTKINTGKQHFLGMEKERGKKKCSFQKKLFLKEAKISYNWPHIQRSHTGLHNPVTRSWLQLVGTVPEGCHKGRKQLLELPQGQQRAVQGECGQQSDCWKLESSSTVITRQGKDSKTGR